MKRPLPLLLFILLNVFQYSCLGQQTKLDSLWHAWQDKGQPDTNRLKAIQEFTWDGYLSNQPDSAFRLAQVQYDFAKKTGHELYMAHALNTQGQLFKIQGDHDKAVDSYKQGLKIFERLGHKKGQAGTLNNIGNIYQDQGDFPKAIDFHKRSLKIKEEIGEQLRVASSLNNIGNIYTAQGNYVKAIENYDESLKIFEQNGHEKGVGIVLNGIGNIYKSQGDFTKAIAYYIKGLEIFEDIEYAQGIVTNGNNIGVIYSALEDYDSAINYHIQSLKAALEIGDKSGMARGMISIGSIYHNLGNYSKAMDFHVQGLKIQEDIGDVKGLARTLNNIGVLYLEQGKTKEALIYCSRSLSVAKEIGAVDQIRMVTSSLYDLYKKIGYHAKALEMYELHIQMRDSIMSEENQREVLRQEYEYEYEKEALADSLLFAKKEALSQAEIKRKGQQRNALMGGLGLITLFSGLLYNRFRVTRKQKEVIEVQKAEVEEKKEQVEKKNEEIMASITYAKKLQTAVLPPARVVKEYFSQSFLLYLPRDIVSGDFYWMESNNDVSYFAVADCTGHGVPGAMLSVIGMNGLNRALNELNLTQPKDILTSLSEHIQRHFEQSEATVRDGMDICLCALNNRTMKLTYAGANNPVWIARNGEMHILKADRRAIGHDDQNRAFTQQEFQLQKDDTVYLASDGYQDQIGGEKNRKLMTKVFRERLIQLSALPMDEQRQTLLAEHEAWKGSGHQTDDICVMGIRV